MLLSMTGFGNASRQTDIASVSIEMKSVNNRYLKLSMRLPDVLARFETDIEKLIRAEIARGAIQVSVRTRLQSDCSAYSIDAAVLKRYMDQILEVSADASADSSLPRPSEFLQLPGVVAESEASPEVMDSLWPLVRDTLSEALSQFQDFRRREGGSMRDDLKLQCETISAQVTEVAAHAPEVVAEYREKLLDRVNKAVQETSVQLEDKDVIREVALFADRCDINEEITRLRSHLEQFHRFLDSKQSLGRKLEFLGQEMFREINTIGSKANNVVIAHSVVEMKAAIERIREVLQNVE